MSESVGAMHTAIFTTHTRFLPLSQSLSLRVFFARSFGHQCSYSGPSFHLAPTSLCQAGSLTSAFDVGQGRLDE